MQLLSEIVKAPTAWDSSANYMGQSEFPGLVGWLTQNRDSEALERSNFECALEALGGESETVEVHRFGHWACGWWEIIAFKLNSPAHEIALKIQDDLDQYPVVNEDHYSEKEWNEESEYWAGLGLHERIELCGKVGISIFNARRDCLPETPTGERITEM
jgi:hypothetical protein